MTRKDYVALAQWVGRWMLEDGAIRQLMTILEEDNRRFSRERFMSMVLEYWPDVRKTPNSPLKIALDLMKMPAIERFDAWCDIAPRLSQDEFVAVESYVDIPPPPYDVLELSEEAVEANAGINFIIRRFRQNEFEAAKQELEEALMDIAREGIGDVEVGEEEEEEEYPGGFPYDPDEAVCPQCGGEGYLLGVLGQMSHFRCRNCGWTFSTDPS